MSAEDVENAIRDALQRADEAGDLVERNVMTLRYAFIDPILLSLGWAISLPWECQPNFELANRGPVDYAFFDRSGYPAVLIEVGTTPARRQRDRVRLWRLARGMTHGVAVLTSGWHWEIYDLSVRARDFDRRRVQRLVLDPRDDDSPRVVAEGLHGWIAKEQWW